MRCSTVLISGNMATLGMLTLITVVMVSRPDPRPAAGARVLVLEQDLAGC
jgi:hypothetical protein